MASDTLWSPVTMAIELHASAPVNTSGVISGVKITRRCRPASISLNSIDLWFCPGKSSRPAAVRLFNTTTEANVYPSTTELGFNLQPQHLGSFLMLKISHVASTSQADAGLYD